MTHEELVTAVELAIDEALQTNRYNLKRSRAAAREAIRITGEACRECLDDDRKMIGNPVMKLTLGGAIDAIKSLTQGNKT